MKKVVVSDIHGDNKMLEHIAYIEANANIYLCLGDSCLPESQLGPFVSVKGNCDYFMDYPLNKIITTPAGNIYAEHGHLRSRITPEFLLENNCKVYLFGHTHRHVLEEIDGIYFVNPGSPTRPRDDTDGTYLVIDIDQNGFHFEFKYL